MMITSEHGEPPEAEAILGVPAALEKQIQGLFQEALGKEQVSTTANFFAEGGSQEQVMPLHPRQCMEVLALLPWRIRPLPFLLYTARG